MSVHNPLCQTQSRLQHYQDAEMRDHGINAASGRFHCMTIYVHLWGSYIECDAILTLGLSETCMHIQKQKEKKSPKCIYSCCFKIKVLLIYTESLNPKWGNPTLADNAALSCQSKDRQQEACIVTVNTNNNNKVVPFCLYIWWLLLVVLVILVSLFRSLFSSSERFRSSPVHRIKVKYSDRLGVDNSARQFIPYIMSSITKRIHCSVNSARYVV